MKKRLSKNTKLFSILIALIMTDGAKQAYAQTSGTPESPVGDCPPSPTWRYDCINKILPCSTKCGTSIATINARVGIGTTNPQATFEIYSRGSGSFLGGFPALMRMHAPDDSPYLFIFSNDKAGSAGDYGAWLDNSGNLRFSNAPSGSFTDRMIITKTGNVGIGNTSPNFKLDISGSLQATGAVKFFFTCSQ